jgi:hypothetical protein
MKFSEYLTQKNPKRLSSFSVEIDMRVWKNEIRISLPLKFSFAGKIIESHIVSIPFNGEYIDYITNSEDDGDLWTMDNDGNKKEKSVFKLTNQFI